MGKQGTEAVGAARREGAPPKQFTIEGVPEGGRGGLELEKNLNRGCAVIGWGTRRIFRSYGL